MVFSAEGASRRKKASLLLALVLLAAALILTILSLGPGTRESETAAPPQPSPTAASPTLPSPSPSGAAPPGGGQSGGGGSGGPGGSGGAECVVGSGGQLSCPESFPITGNAAGLFPGGSVQLPLTVDNPNEQAIRVTSMTVSVTETSSASCGASFVNTTNYTGPGFVIGANGSHTISLPITMSRNAPDSCQSVTFLLSYAGRAEQA